MSRERQLSNEDLAFVVVLCVVIMAVVAIGMQSEDAREIKYRLDRIEQRLGLEPLPEPEPEPMEHPR